MKSPMVNVFSKFREIKEYFFPKIVGEVNEVYVKVVRIKGDKIPWHIHNEEDELFFVMKGKLLLEIKGQESIEMHKGDIFVVRRSEEHRISAKRECSIMLIENKTTAHTGDVKSEITRSIEEQLQEH